MLSLEHWLGALGEPVLWGYLAVQLLVSLFALVAAALTFVYGTGPQRCAALVPALLIGCYVLIGISGP
jgi:hypothetical protein